MTNIYRSLLLVIAGATQKELARQIKFLKVENEILKSRVPYEIRTTPKERQRLLKFARDLPVKVLHQLVTIVHPRTVLRWLSADRKERPKHPRAKPGRRPTPDQLRRLIRKMARENDWGYTRIMGELKKLGINPPSRNTVKNILKAVGLDPGPQRGEATWDEFLKRHAASLWQCDFFSRKIVTWKGMRQAYVLAFINVETRRVVLSPATFKADSAWVEAQAESFVAQARAAGLPVSRVMRDHDGAFSKAFDETLRRKRVKVIQAPFRSPNTNAYIERFVQSIKQECLDHFLVFGLRHFDHLCREYLAYYLTERPHQAKENEVLLQTARHEPVEPETIELAGIRCRKRLGGLLKSYYRNAA